MFHSVPPDNDNNGNGLDISSPGSARTSSAGGGQQDANDKIFTQSCSDNDSDDENVAQRQLSQQSVGAVSSRQIVRRPVSINLAPSDAVQDVPAVIACRPRSRIWAVMGSSGRNDHQWDQNSRTRHKCQSNFECGHCQTAAHLFAQNDDNLPENDSLIARVYEHNPSTQSLQSDTNFRRSRQPSVCSTVDLETPVTSPTSVFGSADETTDSTDSHCHSNVKKGGFDKKARTRLILASVLCLMFMTGEMVGGMLAHSLAIISDAAHLLTDFASFMISLLALYLAHRPATKKLSFGWYRIEILGAFVSILMLWVLTGILVYSAVLRIMDDNYEIDATVMLITAATGVAFNVVLGLTLHQHAHSHGGGGHSHGGGGHSHGSSGHSHKKQKTETTHEKQVLSTSAVHSYGSLHDVEAGERAHLISPAADDEHEGHGHSHAAHKASNINVKAAFIHVLGDLFQSVGVLVAAFIIYYKPEWKVADPICTFLFSVFVLVTTITIMRDIVVVLMEGTPRGINFSEVRNTFFEVDGVLDIHNLRVWSLTMDKIALSVHLAIDRQSDPHKVLKSASVAIKQKFNISETTMQIEEYVTDMIDCQDCQGPKL